MNNIDTTLPASTQVSRTREYEQSQRVEVSRQVRTEQGARTEISKKTTIRKNTEITKIRQQLESKIRELNKKLDELGNSEAQFQISGEEQPAVQLVDPQAGQTFDLKKSVEDFLSTSPSEQTGLLFDTST